MHNMSQFQGDPRNKPGPLIPISTRGGDPARAASISRRRKLHHRTVNELSPRRMVNRGMINSGRKGFISRRNMLKNWRSSPLPGHERAAYPLGRAGKSRGLIKCVFGGNGTRSSPLNMFAPLVLTRIGGWNSVAPLAAGGVSFLKFIAESKAYLALTGGKGAFS